MTYLEGTKESGIKVGDRVNVTRSALTLENGWENSWATGMDSYVGGTYIVLREDDGYGYFIGKMDYEFPYFVLELVDAKPTTKSKDFPHVCPRCGAPAYCGLIKVDCSKGCK
jgi:hypothetical protein